MAVHIIDASNPLPPTYADNDHALDLAAGDTVILAEGATIQANGLKARGINGGIGTTLLIDGTVSSSWSTAIATHGTLNVGVTGIVKGETYGVELQEDTIGGSANVLTNAGHIWGFSTALVIRSDQTTISNSGHITGFYAAISGPYSGKLVINNTGTISSNSGEAIFGSYKARRSLRTKAISRG